MASGLFNKMKSFAPGKGVSALIDPPPPSFTRHPPRNLLYSRFRDTSLLASDNELDHGFPVIVPPASDDPHPFATHDITEEDWTRFLHDIKIAASLSPKDRVVSGVAPMVMGIGITGILVSKGIQKRQIKKKSTAVAELVDHWNHYFFHPRHMDIALAQGAVIYSGPNASSGSPFESDSDSDSSDDEDTNASGQVGGGIGGGLGGGRRLGGRLGGGGLGGGVGGGDRRQKRQERRAQRRGNREGKRDKRGASHEQWRLIISSRA